MSWAPEASDALTGLLAAVESATAAAAEAGTAPIVLIDGPSGAGKSTLADLVAAHWPGGGGAVRIVRMDDLYPGWDGLDAASTALAADLLEPLVTSGGGRWRRWDWAAERPAEWHEVSGASPLIVEGCGTLAAVNVRWAQLALWLEADDTVRKRRALDRDGDVFAAHWDQWQGAFERYLDREEPRAAADLVLDVTDWPLGCAPRAAAGTTVEA